MSDSAFETAPYPSYTTAQLVAFVEAGRGNPVMLAEIDRLNADASVHGILVQLPIPDHIAIRRVLEHISADKDVDGFHLYNVGGLMTGATVFPPCTPYGVQKILEHEKIEVAGRNVVVVGASNIVGKPTAMMLMQQDLWGWGIYPTATSNAACGLIGHSSE